MITTEGFRDILHIARHKRPTNFSLRDEPTPQKHPLVPRAPRMTVPERVTPPDGAALVELDEDAVREASRQLAREAVEAVSVCFLFSFLSPAHERRAAENVREELPDTFVSVSHEIAPMYREYEGFSTTALNSSTGPHASRYIAQLRRGLEQLGVGGEFRLMQSDGGVTSERHAVAKPVTLLMSGPVAGLVGGIRAGGLDGFDSTITLDVVGTAVTGSPSSVPSGSTAAGSTNPATSKSSISSSLVLSSNSGPSSQIESHTLAAGAPAPTKPPPSTAEFRLAHSKRSRVTCWEKSWPAAITSKTAIGIRTACAKNMPPPSAIAASSSRGWVT